MKKLSNDIQIFSLIPNSIQVYLVYRNGGKTLEDTMHNKSTAAKFINRSQARTYASVSSVNASTGQLHYPNGKLISRFKLLMAP